MASFLVQRIVYPLYQLVSGRRILDHWKDFERNQWLLPQEIQTLQINRLHDLLLHAYQHVRFYHLRMESAGINPDSHPCQEFFYDLPLLVKDDILTHLDEL